jgi:mannose-1-phosphate guanylyltransferase/mannose-6-phosphate isomerase
MSARPILPVIMSGGAGTRLWPLSRAAKPKQFLALAGARSLFQETLDRVAPGPDAPFLLPLVICGKSLAGLIAEQAHALGARLGGVICEPAPRNTAAVAAVAAHAARSLEKTPLVLLLPADHHIADRSGFRLAAAKAAAAAETAIVTFGIEPDRPHTGFGYIERGAERDPGVFKVAAFLEKPISAIAESYLRTGRHFWNAGIFLFNPALLLEEFALHAPAIELGARAAYEKAARVDNLVILDTDAFSACPSNSIDYAIMEKTERACVAGPLAVGWSDVGSWAAVEDREDERVFAVEAKNARLFSDGPFIGVIGVDDVIVVATGDAVLVARRDRAEDVKRIIEELRARGRTDLL